MEVSVETCWKSLNKIHEELCGDKVEILKTEDSDVVILADGMGSGVKANILATLTSKILRTMFQKGAPIEQGVETIARTLPICQVRQVAYSTFSILQIFHNGEAYLVEYDNPGCIFVRDGKLMDIPYTVREIEGKKIREYRFQVKLKDCFVLMSDGVIYAGVGELLNFGWTWESMADYTVKCTKDTLSAKRLAAMLSQACDDLYMQKPGDDTDFPVNELDNGKNNFATNLKSNIEKINYMKLKSISIGYTLPVFPKQSKHHARVFMSVENVFTITNSSSPDPESIDIVTGIDSNNNYPLATRFTLGLTLNL